MNCRICLTILHHNAGTFPSPKHRPLIKTTQTRTCDCHTFYAADCWWHSSCRAYSPCRPISCFSKMWISEPQATTSFSKLIQVAVLNSSNTPKPKLLGTHFYLTLPKSKTSIVRNRSSHTEIYLTNWPHSLKVSTRVVLRWHACHRSKCSLATLAQKHPAFHWLDRLNLVWIRGKPTNPVPAPVPPGRATVTGNGTRGLQGHWACWEKCPLGSQWHHAV